MANWYANYFEVKDVKAFKEAVDDFPEVELITQGENLFGLLSTNDGGDFCSVVYTGEDCEEEDFDVLAEIAPHLKDGHVAIAMTIGNEKMRYLTGYAEGINNKAQRVSLNLDHVYEMAKELGEHVTECKLLMSKETIMTIDKELLNKQRLTIFGMMVEKKLSRERIDVLQGVINMLDEIQDHTEYAQGNCVKVKLV